MPRPPTFIDLFAGCGGLSRGFVDAGFEPVLAIENDPAAAATYAANFGEQTVRLDSIEDVEDEAIPRVDVIVGGPPCQGFSGLGPRRADDERNKLWREYLRVVGLAKPKVFVLENVARFFASPEWELLETEFKSGALTEYKYRAGVVDAVDYGVPQHRKRAFIIASLAGEPTFPVATHFDPDTIHGQLSPWRTVRDAFSGLADEPAGNTLPDETINFFGREFRGPFTAADVHVGRTYYLDSIVRYEFVPPGGNRFNVPEELLYACWVDYTGSRDVLGRLEWDKPSVTIRTEFFKPEKGRYLHPEWHEDSPEKSRNRAITHAEALRLQSFPDDFKWCGSKTQVARQIGNAVPPLLAATFARESVLPLLAVRDAAPILAERATTAVADLAGVAA